MAKGEIVERVVSYIVKSIVDEPEELESSLRDSGYHLATGWLSPGIDPEPPRILTPPSTTTRSRSPRE